jgi:insertion element IS1 protein InsB
MLGIEAKKVLNSYGKLYLLFIVRGVAPPQCAVIYTDKWKAYQGMLPSKRHRITEKGSGETNHIERLNNTLRQRVSRLVRKTLAFSKKLINHLGAILCFIDAYLAAL